MTELEERLRDISAKFNHPDKAYAILSRAEEKIFVEIEAYLAILQEKNKEVKTFSLQMLIDYANGIPLNQEPSLPIISSNLGTYPASKYNLGDGNRKISPIYS